MLRKLQLKTVGWGAVALLGMTLSACGGGGGGGGGSGGGGGGTTYTVGGAVTGLNANASVTLQNSGGNALTVSGNTTFTFSTALNGGSSYNVTVATQPTGQTCTVANGQGQNISANVTNIAVACTTNTYTISGTVSGLHADGSITLQNNGGLNLTRSGDGPFAFTDKVTHGDAYSVTVLTQPADQTCTVPANGAGTATGDVSIAVTCTTNANTVGGTVTGLGAGTVVLQNNLGDNLPLSGATTIPFTFQTPVANDAAYFVSVLAQPVGQTCTVAAGSGTATAPVTNVEVTCVNNPATFTLDFTVTGLNGSLTLRNQQRMGATLLSSEDKTIAADGSYTFTTPLTNDTGFFDVSVLTQPATQRCVVFNNLQLAIGGRLLNVRVECTNGTADFSVGGTITGLHTAGLVLVSDVNSTFVLPQLGATNFAFPRKLTPGTPVNIAIGLQPPGQTCIITDNQDTIPAADVAPVRIACVDNTTTPLMGTFAVTDTAGLAGGNRYFLTLYPDGVYLMATRANDPDCGQSNGNGVELGAYTYDGAAGTLTFISNVIDTNGECGVWDGGPSSFTAVQKTGVGQQAVLTLTDPESTFTLTPVPSIPNSLVGSFRLPFVYDVVILDDTGHYTIETANSTGDDDTGIEYGCYHLSGTMTGTFTAESASAVCPDFLDANGEAGLFEPGQSAPVTIPYSILNPYRFGLDLGAPDPALLSRVLPN
jgi:hypothetical protein